MIKLYHLNRSRSLRILWMLEELGLPHEPILYQRDPKTSLAPASLREIHPLGKSPMIEFNGNLIAESGAIVEILAQTHAPHMIPPQGTDAYFHHLELMHFAEGSVMTPILLDLYVGKLGDAGKPLHPRIAEQLTSHFSYMEDVLRPTGHFVLDDLSAADIMLSFPASIALRMGRGAEFPKLAAFVAWMEGRVTYQRALALEKQNA